MIAKTQVVFSINKSEIRVTMMDILCRTFLDKT